MILGLQLSFGQATGAVTQRQASMNALVLIKAQINRRLRLLEAQRIQLKAYRGMPYQDMPQQGHLETDLADRDQYDQLKH